MSSELLVALSEAMGRGIASRLADKLPLLPPTLVIALSEDAARVMLQVFEHQLLGTASKGGERRRPDDKSESRLKEGIRSLCEPGKLTGDILRVALGPAIGEQDQLDALDRLGSGPFSRGCLFHPDRWHGTLEQAFSQYRQTRDESYSAAWRSLAEPAVLVAARGLKDNPPDNFIKEIYAYPRREARKEVEHHLLDGQTLEEYRGRGELPWPEDSTREALELEAGIAESWAEMVDGSIDLARVLFSLPVEDAELMRRRLRGDGFDEIAEDTGEKAGAFRVRWHRLRKKLRQL